jgi:hypothetical protein
MNVRFPTVEAKWSMPYQVQINSQIEQAFDKINEYALIPGGGVQGQILAKASARAFDVAWVNPAATIPYTSSAGTVAQGNGGSIIYATGPITLPALADSTAFTIVNNTGVPITMSPSGTTLIWHTGSSHVVGGTRTLAPGGVVTVHLTSSVFWNVWGTGIS